MEILVQSLLGPAEPGGLFSWTGPEEAEGMPTAFPGCSEAVN